MFRKPLVALSALIAINIVWSSAYAISKVLMDGPWAHLSPLALSFWRLLAATLVLLPLAWHQRPRRPLTGREWASLSAVGLVGCAAAMFLQFIGTQYSSATNAALIITLETVFNCVLAALFLKERMDWRGVVGLVIAFTGVLILSDLDWRTLDLLSNRYALGNGLLVASMLCYAIYSLAGKWAVDTLHPMVVTAYPFAIATVILGLICGWQDPGGLTGITAWSWQAWGGVGYMGIIVTALTYLIWNAVLVHGEVSTMSLTLYVQPVCGAVIAWAALGETMSTHTVAGACAVLLAVALVTIRPRQVGTVKDVKDGLASLPTGR
ncbi:MAG: DMT family transporter [Candidatus Sericytochromatia bacterium]|nr:DMT family transporter [Candidatus Sericytochromatia bacterium]